MAGITSQLLGFRMFTGELMNQIITALNNITGNGSAAPVTASTLTASTSETFSGDYKFMPQIVTAAGSTQGTATAITGSKAVVTVALTVSTKGVKLPVAATGREVLVANAATFGFKIYPFAGGKIGAASTNIADTTLAINKANRYIGVNTTLWVVQRGA